MLPHGMIKCTVPAWFMEIVRWFDDSLIDEETFINALLYLIDNSVATCVNTLETLI